MTNHYKISDMAFTIEADFDKILSERLYPYSVSKADSDVSVRIIKTKTPLQIPKDAKPVKVAALKYYCRCGDCDTVFYHDTKINKTFASIKFSADYTDIEIISYDFSQDYDNVGEYVLYNLLGDAFNYLLQMYSGFAFHSSAISYCGEGVAFSAKSGTGKSTHTSLWLSHFDNTVMINDDMPAIRFVGGKTMMYGTPWAGTTGLSANISVPLKAIVFISRGAENRIEKLKKEAAIKPFFAAITSPFNPRVLSQALATMDKILNTVSVYSLFCNMDYDSAVTARDFIFREGDIS